MSDISIDFQSFVLATEALPRETSVLVRGKHGVGKSQGVKQLAEKLGLPLMERRLSQMSEGDMIGVLDDDAFEVAGRKATEFRPPKWLLECVETPHLIFLDEINRATPEVMQAAFQLVLDREIAGVNIHPECRIFAAVNASAEYQVNEMDPALLDRFWVCDLEPTVEDWLNWARTSLNAATVDFIRQNPSHLEHEGVGEPGKVYPSRRSWERVDTALEANNLFEQPANTLFYHLSRGLVGNEAAIALVDFVKNYELVISAEDILDHYKDNKAKLKACGNDRLHGVIEKIENHCKDNEWTDKQVDNLSKFVKSIPAELVIGCWTKVSEANFANARKLHKRINKLILEVVAAN